eukprot:364343-Chlamydomonas_euryale.AAC.8
MLRRRPRPAEGALLQLRERPAVAGQEWGRLSTAFQPSLTFSLSNPKSRQRCRPLLDRPNDRRLLADEPGTGWKSQDD